MEQKKSNLGKAVIALVALVVGVILGMYMPGGETTQGKLALNKDANSRCQYYKTLHAAGVLSQTIGNNAASKAMVDCGKNYPTFWNSWPTYSECKGTKAREKAGVLSDLMKKQGISEANPIFCSVQYPWLWYNINPNASECYLYKEFKDQGVLTPNIGAGNESFIKTKCDPLVNWDN